MKNWNVFFLIIAFASCSDIVSTKKLDLKVVENKEIKIEHYIVSEISNSYTHIDLTNKRWNKTELILRANSEIIDSVYIKQDSIIITSKYDNPISLLYDLTAKKYGYNIALKTENKN
ncbi:hypothetical protein [Maribacter sp. 4G9]|uniref:hypothetical protein n=1 Tax=Maribacter sp. 4G9 TaxID=1889777 RepID=UPI000C155B24|nr:hypothetical protein [Maribacter sp. 4G9]PIB23567.1 hypothetical protein BFP75_10065 [Maribacter sp. 4G9]